MGGKVKTHFRSVRGHSVSVFKDPSTVAGEWAVRSENFFQYFNARKFTMKEAINAVVDLEVIKATGITDTAKGQEK